MLDLIFKIIELSSDGIQRYDITPLFILTASIFLYFLMTNNLTPRP